MSGRVHSRELSCIPALDICLQSNLKWLTIKMYNVDSSGGLVARGHSSFTSVGPWNGQSPACPASVTGWPIGGSVEGTGRARSRRSMRVF